MTLDPAGAIEPPVWFAALREPTWLVPPVRDDATPVAFCAEAWPERGIDGPGRDLRLGLPLFLAEALRFGTDARAIAARDPVGDGDDVPDASVVVRTAVAPDGDGAVRVRVTDRSGSVRSEIVREATDEPTLAAALESLAYPVAEAVASSGVRPVWNSLYRVPAGAPLVAYVRGLSACLRVADGRLLAPGDDPEAIAARRAEVTSILRSLGTLATSSGEPFTAMVFFGALLAAHDAGSPVVGDFRLPANARCTTATDPVDPVYAMAALVMRVFGDRPWSDRRIAGLRSSASEAMRQWLDRVEAVT